MAVRFFQCCHTLTIFKWPAGGSPALPNQDVGADIEPQSQDGPPRASPSPRGNPLTVNPSLETTPPPGNPHDEFGIGMVPEYQGLDTLHPGQTLIVYHPFAQHSPEVVDTAKLMMTREPDLPPPSEEPYAPFKTRADFEQAKIFIRHNCTNTMINDQLRLNQMASEDGESGIQTMKNAREMHKILAEAGEYQDTSSVSLLHNLQGFYHAYFKVQFRSVEILVPYSHGGNEEDRTYTVHCRPTMEAILDVIEDPDLRPSFIFYPERHYLMNPQTHKLMRAWTDVYTGDDWWQIQVCFYMLKWQSWA